MVYALNTHLYTYACAYVYVFGSMCMYVCMYVCICAERERERERVTKRLRHSNHSRVENTLTYLFASDSNSGLGSPHSMKCNDFFWKGFGGEELANLADLIVHREKRLSHAFAFRLWALWILRQIRLQTREGKRTCMYSCVCTSPATTPTTSTKNGIRKASSVLAC